MAAIPVAPVAPGTPKPLTVGVHLRLSLRQVFVIIVAAVCLVALVSCSKGPDVSSVTVTAGSQEVVIPAALMCYQASKDQDLSCAGGEISEDTPHLALPAGTTVQIDVPQEVGAAPWLVLFAYTDADGVEQGERSPLFTPDTTWSYELTPEPGAKLTRLEVQTLTAAPSTAGGVEFPVVGSWVLLIDTLKIS